MIRKLRVTNTQTGKVWEEHNRNHSWSELALDFENKLIYCDIEILLRDPSDDQWYMLDECGNWEYLPAHYKVEEI